MYEARFKGSKAKKDFKKLKEKLSKKLRTTLRNILENNPYPTPTHGLSLNKVVKKGKLFCYETGGGDRILFDIIEIERAKKAVLIHYSGNHDGEIAYLKKHSK